MTILYYSDPACLEHDNGPGHPEAAVRLRAIETMLQDAPLQGLVREPAPEATREQVERAHPSAYVGRILDAVPNTGYVGLDADTTLSPGSGGAILHAAGGAVAAVDAVLGGQAKRAFVGTRPPGHHAERATAMGFCLFNNVAVAALHARHAHRLGKIAVFDFDVHHGNGTQDIFWDDPETLFVSTHQMPLYPGSGARGEQGSRGTIVNLPYPPGTASKAWRALVEREVLPRMEAFAPKLVLLSAGFDAHERDPLAQTALVEDDFRWVAERAVESAERHAEGRVVAVLEGGYDPPALAASVQACLEGLAVGAA